MNRAGEARPPCRLSTAEALPAPISCGIWVASVNENKKQGTSHPHGCGSTRDAPTAGLDVRHTDPHAVVEDRQRAVGLAGSGGTVTASPTDAGGKASVQPRQARALSSSFVSLRPQDGVSVPTDARAGSPRPPGYRPCAPPRESWLSARLFSPDPARPGSPGQTALTEAKRPGAGTPGCRP